MDQIVELEQLVQPHENGTLYRWTDHGRARYFDWWVHRVTRHAKELKSGRDVIRRTCNSTWWDWEDGSRPIHWKWPASYQTIIQHGLPIWFREAPRQWRRAQAPGKNKVEHARMTAKLKQVRQRRYIEQGDVISLTSFFSVP